MKRFLVTSSAALALSAGIWWLAETPAQAFDQGEDPKIDVLDNCDPSDPGWTPVGGCFLKQKDGDVSAAEFFQFLFSPLGGGAPGGILIGHPSWRNEPSYLSLEEGKTLRVRNRGGRQHTFTEVAEFGGGRVGILNGGLAQAGACVAPGVVDLEAGARQEYKGLKPGIHRFQCCIHPWMRATVRVSAK